MLTSESSTGKQGHKPALCFASHYLTHTLTFDFALVAAAWRGGCPTWSWLQRSQQAAQARLSRGQAATLENHCVKASLVVSVPSRDRKEDF